MAIRIRNLNGETVALCAAEYPAKEGDIYLDDVIDHAIRKKIFADFKLEGLIDGNETA